MRLNALIFALVASALALPISAQAEDAVRYIPMPSEWLTQLQGQQSSTDAPAQSSAGANSAKPIDATDSLLRTELAASQVPQINSEIKKEREYTAKLLTNVLQNSQKLKAHVSAPLKVPSRLMGRILLQVHTRGEAYYVNPQDGKLYFLGKSSDAFVIMRQLGLGASHAFISRYLGSLFPNRVAGRILIDVDDHGKAYYINPDNKKAYYLDRPSDALKILQGLGLGISNADLAKFAQK